jgi:histidinol-phosphate/aromatic aminotransferase/cobyric acid decarboxylase-like protein
MVRRGVLIRPGHELGLPGWARITVGPEDVMDRAADALLETRLELLGAGAPAR